MATPRNSITRIVSPNKPFGANFFPVASGVQIPYVGQDESLLRIEGFDTPTIKQEDLSLHLANGTKITSSHEPGLTTDFINTTSKAPYSETPGKVTEVFVRLQNGRRDKTSKTVSRSYLKKVTRGLNFSDDVLNSWAPFAKPYNESETKGVYKTSGISHHKKKSIGLVGRHDPPGRVKRHGPCYLNSPRKLEPLKKNIPVLETSLNDSSLNKLKVSQEIRLQENNRTEKGGKPKRQWDEHVLASISKSTAEWIINDHIVGPEKERLSNFLKKLSEKQDITEKLSQTKTSSSIPVDNKMNEEKALAEKKDVDANYSPSFCFPKKVGDKKLSTENFYQQELLGGAQPVPRKSEPNIIVLDTNEKVKFQKQLQENFPQKANVWFAKKNKRTKNGSEAEDNHSKKPVKGATRWSQLPVIVQDDAYTPQSKELNVDVAALSEGYRLKKKIKEDNNIVKIADEWRSKWFLENKWQKSTTQELIQAMDNINDHVRLAAVSACSKAAEIRRQNRHVEQLGITLEKPKEEEEASLGSQLEPELIEAIRKLLDDSNSQVRIASAITLYTLNKENDKAAAVLDWTIEHGGALERWAATQCLAFSGVISYKVVLELVHHLHADNVVRAERACTLLAQMSQHSGIVQAMVAELLNSSSWRDRSKGCQFIPKLKFGTNRDMTQKLSYLMWNDWSKEVRIAAAQALGKTGNGKVVHDALRERLMTGNERDKVDALKKVSNLGIMTARLLPALLKCFHSSYVSVRIEAALAAGTLKVSDEKVVDALLRIAAADPSWKVKARAIQALASIGVVNEKLHEMLLWAIRYEKVAAVRAEACSAVATLGITDSQLVSLLQDRIVVETDEFVKCEAMCSLQQLGVEPTGDVEMLQAIRREVQARCTRDAIVAHILHKDRKSEYKEDYKKFLTTEDEENETGSIVEKRKTSRRSRAISEGSSRGWDPILAGYQARELMSCVPALGDIPMELSLLPMDLNSASSENSSVAGSEDWDKLSDSEESKSLAASQTGQEEAKDKMVTTSPNSLQNISSSGTNDRAHTTQQNMSAILESERNESVASPDETDDFLFITDDESNKDEPELMALAEDDKNSEAKG